MLVLERLPTEQTVSSRHGSKEETLKPNHIWINNYILRPSKRAPPAQRLFHVGAPDGHGRSAVFQEERPGRTVLPAVQRDGIGDGPRCGRSEVIGEGSHAIHVGCVGKVRRCDTIYYIYIYRDIYI